MRTVTLAHTEPVMEATPYAVMERGFDFSSSASTSARIFAREWLTTFKWEGHVEGATTVVAALIDNAVAHAPRSSSYSNQTVGLRINLTTDRALLIDVYDPLPDFPDFERAIGGEEGRGLWTAQHMGAELSWFLCNHGKAVRAHLRPGPVPV